MVITHLAKGQQCFTYGRFAVSQAIKTTLALLQKEWWEDVTAGVPLFQSILGQPGTTDRIAIVDMLYKKAISGVQDVISIQDFTSGYEDRTYTFACSVTTKYGIVAVTS